MSQEEKIDVVCPKCEATRQDLCDFCFKCECDCQCRAEAIDEAEAEAALDNDALEDDALDEDDDEDDDGDLRNWFDQQG